MAVSAFSEDGKYYSIISKDGRLKIWDTETNALKQEYTPDLHLTAPPSCLQWITVSSSCSSPPKGGKRKQSFSEQETQCIVLGTTSGKLLLYSVTQAKVENVISESKQASRNITTLDWHRRYGLYSSSKSGIVIEWDLHSGSIRNKYNVTIDNGKQGSVSAIKIVPHNQNSSAKFLVTASWQVCLWQLLDGSASIVKKLGHNTSSGALLSVVNNNNETWLLEGSLNERLLSLWDITVTADHIPHVNGDDSTPNKRQRKKSITLSPTTPAYSFVLEDAPRFIDVQIRQEDNGNVVNLSAATRSGVIHYYTHALTGTSTKPIKPSVTVQVSSAEAVPLPLQCCRLHDSSILLGYSTGPGMLFEKLIPDLSSKTQVLIRGESRAAKNKKNKQNNNDVNKVRADVSNDVNFVEPMGGVARKRTAPGAKVEVPMEARLENLSLDPKSRSKSAVCQNLTKLLIQGLHSNDKSLILMVLQKNDASVATQTVSALPASYVPALLEQLGDMATRKTSQCASVCTWLTATLRCHSALLLATAGTKPTHHLTHLLALFTQRRSHLCQLLNLAGRLELTMAQRSATHAEQMDQEALLEYKDTSSDEEMELEQYQSTSEHSWSDKDADSDEQPVSEDDSGGE